MRAVLLGIMIAVCCTACSVSSGSRQERESGAWQETKQEAGYVYSEKEVRCRNGSREIYGILYQPEREGKVPLVIYSHGLNSTFEAGVRYGHYWAEKGIALYCFDFCGGSENSRSDGSCLEMSVMTEVSDLEAVLKTAMEWDFLDTERIVLAGESQGGLVTALAAAQNADKIEAAILQCPAFNIPDMVHETFQAREDIPDRTFFKALTVGRPYFEDVWELDPYAKIGTFEKPVLLLHGTRDDIVDISYSEYAARIYEDAELERIGGAGHHLIGDQPEQLISCMDSFLAGIGWEELE